NTVMKERICGRGQQSKYSETIYRLVDQVLRKASARSPSRRLAVFTSRAGKLRSLFRQRTTASYAHVKSPSTNHAWEADSFLCSRVIIVTIAIQMRAHAILIVA